MQVFDILLKKLKLKNATRTFERMQFHCFKNFMNCNFSISFHFFFSTVFTLIIVKPTDQTHRLKYWIFSKTYSVSEIVSLSYWNVQIFCKSLICWCINFFILDSFFSLERFGWNLELSNEIDLKEINMIYLSYLLHKSK